MAIERIGEVIESTSAGFTAQCYRLYQAPPLGALVHTAEPAVYAVVCNVTTQGLDPTRRPAARGEGAATVEAVYQNNPQIAQLLRTEFQALTLGYSEDDRICQCLPPLPPKIHSFVYPCADAQMRVFARAMDFLPLLLSEPTPTRDELVAACLRRMATVQQDSKAFLVRAGKELAGLLSNDGQRLNTLLRRLLS